MSDLRWPRILLIALLALLLFFGTDHIYRRYFKEENLCEKIRTLEGVAGVEIINENRREILLITPADNFQGRLQTLVGDVEKAAASHWRKAPAIEIKDKRSAQLELFAAAVSPDLYEAVRSGRYRAAAEKIKEAAAFYHLSGEAFTVDERYIYLQARDGKGSLYLIIPLPTAEGGTADA